MECEGRDQTLRLGMGGTQWEEHAHAQGWGERNGRNMHMWGDMISANHGEEVEEG